MKLGQVSDSFEYTPSLGQITPFFRQEEHKDELKQTLHVLSLCCAVSVISTRIIPAGPLSSVSVLHSLRNLPENEI